MKDVVFGLFQKRPSALPFKSYLWAALCSVALGSVFSRRDFPHWGVMVYRYKPDKRVGREKTNTKVYPAISAGHWLVWKLPASHISHRKMTGTTVLQVGQARSILMVSWVLSMSSNFSSLGTSLGWPHFCWVMTGQFRYQQRLCRKEGQAGAVRQGTLCHHMLC